jgi:hypothetical protein
VLRKQRNSHEEFHSFHVEYGRPEKSIQHFNNRTPRPSEDYVDIHRRIILKMGIKRIGE